MNDVMNLIIWILKHDLDELGVELHEMKQKFALQKIVLQKNALQKIVLQKIALQKIALSKHLLLRSHPASTSFIAFASSSSSSSLHAPSLHQACRRRVSIHESRICIFMYGREGDVQRASRSWEMSLVFFFTPAETSLRFLF